MTSIQMYLASKGSKGLGLPPYNPDFSVDIPTFNPPPDFSTGGNSPTIGGVPSTNIDAGTGKAFADTKVGGALSMLLQNGAGFAQIYSAINGGKSVDMNGQIHNLSNVKSEVDKIATQNGQSSEEVVKMLIAKLEKEKQDKKRNKTIIYVGVGVGVLALISGVYLVTKNNNKKK